MLESLLTVLIVLAALALVLTKARRALMPKSAAGCGAGCGGCGDSSVQPRSTPLIAPSRLLRRR